jgi:uncharacterized protein involved in exopolysaccharide biosynthesis
MRVAATDRDLLRVEVLKQRLGKLARRPKLVAQLAERDAAVMTVRELEHSTSEHREHIGVIVQRLRDADSSARGPERGEVLGVEL